MSSSLVCLRKAIQGVTVWWATAALLTGTVLAAPSLKLSKTSGPPTTNITVSGSGFTASSLIDIYFDTTDTVLVVSSSTGTLSKIALQVPAAAQPGKHWVTAAVRASGIAAQKSFLVRTNWVERGFTPKNKRSNLYENVLNPSTVGSIDVDWSFATGNAVYSSPAVANGVVYVGSYDDNVYALNATTGVKLWSFPTGSAVYSSPAVANGVVYVGSEDSNLYAFDQAGGMLAKRNAALKRPDPAVLVPDYSLKPRQPSAGLTTDGTD